MSTFSSSGERIACSAATFARPLPAARPVPMIAAPLSFITVRTSAKSRLTTACWAMMSLMPRVAS